MRNQTAGKPLAGKKVAVLVETEYIYDEIQFYRHHVAELGGELTLLSYLWDKPSIDLVNDVDSPDRPVTDMHRLTVSECVTRHDPTEFDIVICAANYVAVRLREIPPMGSLGSPALTRSAPAVQFFARAMENTGILKAAMCHALWILTPRPDLLRGRHVICHTVVLADIVNAGAVYIPAPSHIVVDRDLVTARSFADIEAYFQAIVSTATSAKIGPPPVRATKDILNDTAAATTEALLARLAQLPNHVGGERPVAKAARGLVAGTLDVGAEVRRMTGVDFDQRAPAKHQPILLLASKFGVWASELTVVAGALLRAGYRVKLATEDGSPPHLLGVSLDPTFLDGAWRIPVVSPEEQELGMRFLDPRSTEHALLRKENILDLSALAKPPQVGDYLKDPGLVGEYKERLRRSLDIAAQFDAIIVAGGSGAIPGFMFDRGLHSLILAFYKLGKPVMGECNGGLAIAQTTDPSTGRSILYGRATTTHSWLDEYQSGWGWTRAFGTDTDTFWHDTHFDLGAYLKAEQFDTPGIGGNPLIDSEALFKNAAGPDGLFFSPPGTDYSVVVDEHLISCRTTPDGYPGVVCLMAVMDGRPSLRGRFFIDADERGKRSPARGVSAPEGFTIAYALDAARNGDVGALARWLVQGGDPDVADEEGWTPLLLAAAHGQSSAVELLLFHDIPGARHADPDRRFPGADGLPIYMAGQSADLPTVKTLLRSRPGHLFDVASVNGHTILLQAAFYGQRKHQELAAYLLEQVGEILAIPSSDSRTIAAVRKRLMSATNVRGQNPLQLAQAYNIVPMMNLLREYDVTTEQECAAYYRHLLTRIAPPPPRNEQEQHSQCLTEAIIEDIQDAIDAATDHSGADDHLASIDRMLKEPAFEINRLGSPLQRTPLIVACTGADSVPKMAEIRAEIVDRLLKHGADPLIHEVHAMGVNAVIRAAVWGHLYVLERFAAATPTQRFTDALNERPLVNGFTPLHDSVLRALSAQGDAFDAYLRQIEWLVERGAQYDIPDHTGLTQEGIAQAALNDPDFQDHAKRILSALHRN